MRLADVIGAWGKRRGSPPPAEPPGGDVRGAGPLSPTALKERYLSAIDVFRDLPPEALERLARTTIMLTCVRGRTIYRAGDTSETLFLLKKGRVQIVRETVDGKRLTIAVLGPETFFGEMALVGQRLPRDSSAEAVDDAVICAMGRPDVEQLILTYPRVGLRFLEQVGARLAETESMVEDFAFKPVAARLASALLRLAGSDYTSPIEVSHQELADMAATHRETATLTLHQFRGRGMVELGRRSVRILDAAALQAEVETAE